MNALLWCATWPASAFGWRQGVTCRCRSLALAATRALSKGYSGYRGLGIALLATLAVAPGHASTRLHEVKVHIAGRELRVPVPPGMTVASPGLVSAEQSAAVPLGFRLMSVFTGEFLPGPEESARVVLVETTTEHGGRISNASFARMRELAAANVRALASRGGVARAGTVSVPRVLVDKPNAFAWIAAAKGEDGTGVPATSAVAGTLYVVVHSRLIVLSLRAGRATRFDARWIKRETHWLLGATQRANVRGSAPSGEGTQ